MPIDHRANSVVGSPIRRSNDSLRKVSLDVIVGEAVQDCDSTNIVLFR